MMLFRVPLITFMLCFASQADAYGLSLPDYDDAIFAGVRVSYQKNLGFGFGVHTSYWVLDTRKVPPFSATAGAAWYQRGKLRYAGLQTGSLAGVSAGFFAQEGKSGYFTGKYYELWGALYGGVSIRQFIKRGEGFLDTPVDFSLFGTFPVVVDGTPGGDFY